MESLSAPRYYAVDGVILSYSPHSAALVQAVIEKAVDDLMADGTIQEGSIHVLPMLSMAEILQGVFG